MTQKRGTDAQGLRLLSTLAVMGAMRELVDRRMLDDLPIDADFAPTLALLRRLRGGEPADIVILTRQGIDELSAEGIVEADSIVDVALSSIGIAVRAGAAWPDISTVAALRAALLGARSVAYSRIGASGQVFAALLERLGIAEAVNAKASIVPSGFTAERLGSGEAELAVQQISELMMVPGIEVVGPLPAELQTPAMFSAGRPRNGVRTAEAERLLHFLASPDFAPILQNWGLEPPVALG